MLKIGLVFVKLDDAQLSSPKSALFSAALKHYLTTSTKMLITWATVGGGARVGDPPPPPPPLPYHSPTTPPQHTPGKLLYGRPFCYFCLHVKAFLERFFPMVGLLLFLSMCRGLFVSRGGHFFVLAPLRKFLRAPMAYNPRQCVWCFWIISAYCIQAEHEYSTDHCSHTLGETVTQSLYVT